MKWLFLILAISCTSAPPVKKLVLKDIKAKDCLKPLEDAKLNTIQTFAGLLQQTAGTGLAGTFYLCARDSLFCEDIVSGYVEIMEEADMLWSTKKAYNNSVKWRCPQVDHISNAFRKVSSCLYVKGEYVAAFEQLALIEENMVMSDCMTDLEKEKIQELKAKLIYNIK